MFTPERKSVAPTAQDAAPTSGAGFGGVDWLRRANAALDSSTTFMDTNYRKQWEDSLRAFHSQHPSDSKYNAPSYEKRSRLYRPKTRTIIRKNEAAAAAAFFSNMDTVSIGAEDQSNKEQLVNAEIMKALMQYRLTKSVPWFQTVLGGLQDAQTMGVVCAHIYWEYEAGETDESTEESGEPEAADPEEYPTQGELPKGAFTMDANNEEEAPAEEQPLPPPKVDKPCIDLIPVENIRISPAAKWYDPVHSSPFFIHLIPMYSMDVKAKMESGEWNKLGDGYLQRAQGASDSTRAARQKDRDEPTQSNNDRSIDDYDIVWVHRNIHRFKGNDYEFYTLADIALLSNPRPLKTSVLHGKRPYEMGCCILETHRIMPSGVYQLSKGLQDEANEVVNQRLDNVKFSLNKKWFAKRGRDVDVAGLVRNIPGGVVMMDDPEKDVREISWPDVTQSAYEEQNRINLDMDELLGNFNPAGLMTAGAHQNSPAKNMSMLNQANATMVEYMIRTYVETFVQPVLRQLILLEQHYETDEVLLALAQKQAPSFQKYGVNAITDSLLKKQLTLTVNVGMGATDPGTKLTKFLSAMGAFSQMSKNPPPGVNLQEVGKEIFGHLGYSDGSRFFTNDNPQVLALQEQLKKMAGELQQTQMALKDKQTQHLAGLAKTHMTNQAKLKGIQIQEDHEDRRNVATHISAIMAHNHGHASAMEQLKVKNEQRPGPAGST
jgi:hypothetical protein